MAREEIGIGRGLGDVPEVTERGILIDLGGVVEGKTERGILIDLGVVVVEGKTERGTHRGPGVDEMKIGHLEDPPLRQMRAPGRELEGVLLMKHQPQLHQRRESDPVSTSNQGVLEPLQDRTNPK